MSSSNEIGDLEIFVGPRMGKKRLVVLMRGGTELYRDEVATDSERDRNRWQNSVKDRALVAPGHLDGLITTLLAKSDEADQQAANNRVLPSGHQSQADQLVELATDVELIVDIAQIGYARFERNGHRETWPIRDKGFKQWLITKYYAVHQKAPRNDAVENAIATLESKAIFEACTSEVYVRYAKNENAVYVDLCNAEWQVVEITRDGWTILNDSPVRFRRTNGMLPLPLPQRGGTLRDLHRLINVPEDDLPLVDAWLISAAQPSGPFCILILVGEQGTAKSTLTKSLRALLDPNKAPLRAEPRDERDLLIAAKNSWVLAFDNLSYLKPWLSDALCRLATGSGFATRQLFTDDAEVLFSAQRPIILNSIDDLATRSDLLDRAIVLPLEQIPETQRRTEAGYWAEFEQARPRILGALYDAVSVALRNLPEVQTDRLPRMADFAKFAIAAEPAMGVPAGTFLECFLRNRESIDDIALESTPLAAALQTLIRNTSDRQWSGTATQLYERLTRILPDAESRQRAWPRTPRGLASIIRRITPNLRHTGINIEFHRSGQRLITIQWEGESGEQTSAGYRPPYGRPVIECVATASSDAAHTPGENARSDANDDVDANLRPQSGDLTNTGDDSDEWEERI